ncbi:hypothetical protein ACHAWO_005172 [Cyclotella atomus]|uniref:Uncharacterized protein n=1 Tax=Cyclotella atomus TaxID=382360 RepID=A0ABD3N9I8_9STRA
MVTKYGFTLVALVVPLVTYIPSDGFEVHRKAVPHVPTRRTQLHSTSMPTTKRPSKNQHTSGLRFKASTMYKSKDAPLPQCNNSVDKLTSFFDTDKTYFHLLAKGTRNRVHDVDKHQVPKYLDRWTKEAHMLGCDKPTTNDLLLALSVTTPFLVLVLKVTAIIGVKLVWRSYSCQSTHESIKLPEYQFILLDQSFSADGPPPLVFIFNQLTGINKTAKGTYEQPNHALFTATAEPSQDRRRVAFVSNMTAEINVRFPELLLKLLPVRKEVIEKEGSASLKKNMERDVHPGVDLFRNAYVDWLKE